VKTRSQTVKACGLKSVTECAELNGISRQTMYDCSNDAFVFYVLNALDVKAKRQRKTAVEVLNNV
jgi:hypothetical protein